MTAMTTTYDSAPDTRAHIDRVHQLIGCVLSNLADRAIAHDASKLLPPEKAAFDAATPLRGLSYGSEGYQEALASLQDALAHHYANNRHHPEHHRDGVGGMTLLDLVEMLCDWKAATERHADGDLEKSLVINQERFGMSDELVGLLRRTAAELGFLPVEGVHR